MTFQPIAGLIGAEVHGAPSLDAFTQSEADTLALALADYGVLFLRTSTLDPAAHLSFASRFGEISAPSALIESLVSQGYPEIGVISTDNKLAYASDRWHTDVTWSKAPSKYSILHMQETPQVGGDTMWASQFAAFESLSERTKGYLTGLSAHHCAPGRPEHSADHPLVCCHPLTGRRALFFNELFTVRVNELPPDESNAVISLMGKRCVQPEHTCRWHWQPGDIAIWDNHFVQHYALGDYHPASRRIHRIEICGEPPIPAV